MPHSTSLPTHDLVGNEIASFDYKALLGDRGQGKLDLKMGITMVEVSPLKLVATMPVEGNQQAVGLLHGGANVVLAESLGSIGTALFAGLNRRIVGIDINATHHKSATSGIVTAVATPITLGKTLTCYEIAIFNEAGERTFTSRITCLILADRN
jgi:uncharacterized protein (TIGR00369 family)